MSQASSNTSGVNVGGVGIELRVPRDHAQQGQRVAGGVVQAVRQWSRVRADHSRHFPGADDLVSDLGDQPLEIFVLLAEPSPPPSVPRSGIVGSDPRRLSVPADKYAALDERFDVDLMDVSDDDPAEEIHLASS